MSVSPRWLGRLVRTDRSARPVSSRVPHDSSSILVRTLLTKPMASDPCSRGFTGLVSHVQSPQDRRTMSHIASPPVQLRPSNSAWFLQYPIKDIKIIKFMDGNFRLTIMAPGDINYGYLIHCLLKAGFPEPTKENNQHQQYVLETDTPSHIIRCLSVTHNRYDAQKVPSPYKRCEELGMSFYGSSSKLSQWIRAGNIRNTNSTPLVWCENTRRVLSYKKTDHESTKIKEVVFEWDLNNTVTMRADVNGSGVYKTLYKLMIQSGFIQETEEGKDEDEDKTVFQFSTPKLSELLDVMAVMKKVQPEVTDITTEIRDLWPTQQPNVSSLYSA